MIKETKMQARMRQSKESGSPIYAAVEPIKADAIESAKQEAADYIKRIYTALDAASWDLNAYAPHPKSWGTSREDYRRAQSKRNVAQSITSRTGDSYNYPRDHEPHFVERNLEGSTHFIEMAMDNAAAQYDAFVFKLVHKVGACVAATLNGNHVWGYSELIVTKADGLSEKWRTQMIVNYSIYGLAFNQWPSRKVK